MLVMPPVSKGGETSTRSAPTKSSDEKIPKDMLELASHIVTTKAGHFEPSRFDDRYEDALKDYNARSGRPIVTELEAVRRLR